MNTILNNSLLLRLLRLPEAIRQMRGTDDSSVDAAAIALPRIQEHVQPLRSVIDLGCGHGQWLSVFRDAGCAVKGYDAKAFSPKFLSPDEYQQLNLATPYLFRTTRADLAISLEVAEHIPDAAGRLLVGNLTGISNSVLFSAAIPGQGGWGHINEQPHKYWDDQFTALGYRIGCTFEDINFGSCWWYQQNMRLYVRQEP